MQTAHIAGSSLYNKKLFKKSDILIIAGCLLLAGVVFLPRLFGQNENLTAVITADNQIFQEISLADAPEQTFEVNHTKITVKDGEIFFSESDCKDKVCLKTGKLGNAGDSSACIPNKVSIYIKGGTDEVDAVAY